MFYVLRFTFYASLPMHKPVKPIIEIHLFEVVLGLEEVYALGVEVGVEEGRACQPAGGVAGAAVAGGERWEQFAVELGQVARQVEGAIADADVGQAEVRRGE